MAQIVPRHLMPLLIPLLYTDEKVRPEFQGEFLTSRDLTFAYGFGIEGIREVAHQPDNAVAFYPHSKTVSKFDATVGDLHLPEEYQIFLDKFDSVILIAFGTTFMPIEEDMLKLFDAVKLADDSKIGFVISLKEHLSSYTIIKEANLPNVFLSKWVPQKELLKQEKLKMFVTHGGANSIFESLYFGTPLMGFAQNGDQFGMIYRLKRMGVARFGNISNSPEQILTQFEELTKDDCSELYAAKKVMR